jgi:hypothetical protein
VIKCLSEDNKKGFRIPDSEMEKFFPEAGLRMPDISRSAARCGA